MPRPSEPEKRRIEANRKHRQALLAQQADREKRQDELVQGLIDNALSRVRTGQFGLEEALHEFDEARSQALALRQPAAAARCTWYKAQLVGLLVQQHAVAVGSPQDFSLAGSTEEARQRITDRLIEQHGLSTKRAQKLISKIEHEFNRIKDGDDDDIIDGEATDVE
jgi:hypothetical protein